MKSRMIFFIAVLVVAGISWGAMESVHPFGFPGETPMDTYFVEHAQKDRGANNVVTSIVFDYRGFDTLGEAAVLFTAVSSIALIFRKGGRS